jgi:hypothetical protein
MNYPIPSKHMKAAMDAQSNLNILAAIEKILEGGTFHGECAAQRKIIAICKQEQQRQLGLMDRAVAAINKDTQ